MYWVFTILAAIIVLGFLSKCFVMWLTAKVIRADGGSWSNCVRLNWIYIWTCVVLVIVALFIAFMGGSTYSFAFVVAAVLLAVFYLIKKTMEVLEIGFLMFILFCFVESIIESAISGGIFYTDKLFPFIGQVQALFQSAADKF